MKQILIVILSVLCLLGCRTRQPQPTPAALYAELVRVYGAADAASIWEERGFAPVHPRDWGDVTGKTGTISD